MWFNWTTCGWQCCVRVVWILTCLSSTWHQHRRTHALCSLFSPMRQPVLLGHTYMFCKIRFGSKIMTRGPDVHSILMCDAVLQDCVLCSEWHRLHSALHQLVGGERHVGPIELLLSELIWQTPAEGNRGASHTSETDAGEKWWRGQGLPTGKERTLSCRQLKNDHFIHSMHYLYWTHILSWHVHWVITLGYS